MLKKQEQNKLPMSGGKPKDAESCKASDGGKLAPIPNQGKALPRPAVKRIDNDDMSKKSAPKLQKNPKF